MTDDRNLRDDMTRPDPFLRFYNACDDAYRDHMALATCIKMSCDTWMAFVRHWPRYYGYTDNEPRSLTHPSALTEIIKGMRVPIEEDNGLPYGEMLVTFNNPHNRPADYTVLVVVMKGWER